MSDLDKVLSDLSGGCELGVREARVVQSQDGTTRALPNLTANTTAADQFVEYAKQADALFADRPAYVALKKEQPQHRLILWYTVRGIKPREIAALLRCDIQTVYYTRKQPWFRESFCRLTSEMGKDAVQTLLEGEVLPAIERTIELAKNADSDAVRLAANREVLDRFLGKSTVKIESKVSATVDQTVADVTKLLAEKARVDQQLAANGHLNLAGPS